MRELFEKAVPVAQTVSKWQVTQLGVPGQWADRVVRASWTVESRAEAADLAAAFAEMIVDDLAKDGPPERFVPPPARRRGWSAVSR